MCEWPFILFLFCWVSLFNIRMFSLDFYGPYNFILVIFNLFLRCNPGYFGLSGILSWNVTHAVWKSQRTKCFLSLSTRIKTPCVDMFSFLAIIILIATYLCNLFCFVLCFSQRYIKLKYYTRYRCIWFNFIVSRFAYGCVYASACL